MKFGAAAQKAVKLSLSDPKSFASSRPSLYAVQGLPAHQEAFIVSLVETDAFGQSWGIYRSIDKQVMALPERYASAAEALSALARIVDEETVT